jgi:hypothetical protein
VNLTPSFFGFVFLHRVARIHVQHQQQRRQYKRSIFTVNAFRAKEDKLSLLYKQPHVDIESTTLYATFAKIAAAIVVVVEF